MKRQYSVEIFFEDNHIPETHGLFSTQAEAKDYLMYAAFEDPDTWAAIVRTVYEDEQGDITYAGGSAAFIYGAWRVRSDDLIRYESHRPAVQAKFNRLKGW